MTMFSYDQDNKIDTADDEMIITGLLVSYFYLHSYFQSHSEISVFFLEMGS